MASSRGETFLVVVGVRILGWNVVVEGVASEAYFSGLWVKREKFGLCFVGYFLDAFFCGLYDVGTIL